MSFAINKREREHLGSIRDVEDGRGGGIGLLSGRQLMASF